MAYQRRLRLEHLEGRQLLASDVDLGPFDSLAAKSKDLSSAAGDGVRAAEVRIQFDPAKVSPQATDFLPGPAWQGKGAIVTNVDATEGTVTAFLFSIEPIDSASGDLIDIRLPMGPALPDDTTPAYAIESITVDEGQKAIDPAEHRVDPVVSEVIKRQVQSRNEKGDGAKDSSNMHDHQPSVVPVVDQVYGPFMPNWLDDASVTADQSTSAMDQANQTCPAAATDDSSWNDFLNKQSEDRGSSRSILLMGVRDDWSELDRIGHRKA